MPDMEMVMSGGARPKLRVEAVAADGSAVLLAAADYAIDIDARGDGWVRIAAPVEGRIRVGGQAGIASGPNGVPEPLRQGILRLVAHLFATRDGGTQVEIVEGCDKMLATCSARFGNAANFRGEPHLPGNDLLTRYPGA